VTIEDDDPEPTLSIQDVYVTEGDSDTVDMEFTVQLSAESAKTVTVEYETVDSIAESPGDYSSAGATLTFDPGDTTQTFTVSANGDTISEIDEPFDVELSSAENADEENSDLEASGWIVNDEQWIWLEWDQEDDSPQYGSTLYAPVNDDTDEDNRQGIFNLTFVRDNQQHYDMAAGESIHRIVSDDDELRGATVVLDLPSVGGYSMTGEWYLDYDESKVLVWDAATLELIEDDERIATSASESISVLVEGIAYGAPTITAYFDPDAYGQPTHDWYNSLTVYDVDLLSVEFSDSIAMKDHYQDNNGDNLQDTTDVGGGAIAEPNADVNITGPEWIADDKDGGAADDDLAPESKKHALVPKNTQFEVKATFSIGGSYLLPGSVSAWAECSADSDFNLASETNPVQLSQDGDNWVGTFQVAAGADSIGVEQIDWTWHIKADPATDDDVVGSSSHELLVWKEAISDYTPYDWVAWLSCKWAEGKTTDAEIADAIGTKAKTDSEVGTVISGVDLDYELDGTANVIDLLQYRLDDTRAGTGTYHRFGNCHAFSSLLQDMARVQSIDIVRDSVESTWAFRENPVGYYHVWGTESEDRDDDSGPGYPVPRNGELDWDFEGDWIWLSHGFCSYGSRIYDPATGQKYIGTWQEYFLSLMTRYVKIVVGAKPLPSTERPDDPDNDTVPVKHGENGVLVQPDYYYLP